MRESIKLVIFDLDGTVLDTREFLYQGFEHAIKSHKLPHKSRADLDHVISTTKYLPEAYALLGIHDNVEEIIKTHISYRSQNLHLIKTFPEVIETLSHIKTAGIKITALTNRLKQLHESLEITGVKKYLDLLITKSDIIYPKPHPEGIEKILSHFSIPKNQALIVGDTEDDIIAGKNAGIKTVAVSYGFGAYRIKKSNPDYLVNHFSELLQIIVQTNTR